MSEELLKENTYFDSNSESKHSVSGLDASAMFAALSDDYHSVYYVDLAADEILPLRLSETIEQEYGAYFRTKPSYEDAIHSYIARTVLSEEQNEMREKCSVAYLTQQLSRKNVYRHDYCAMRAGKLVYCRMKVVKVQDGPELQQFVIAFADISEEKQQELERYAYVDLLTGGNNSVSFKKKLAQSGQSGYLISIDVHSFKIINSICGIQKGDESLKGIWNCILPLLNEDDLAGHIKFETNR